MLVRKGDIMRGKGLSAEAITDAAFELLDDDAIIEL